jgi:hypothetical protein
MRIWDISVERLCDKHLLGEHLELHAIWAILTDHKKGYSKHPETLRWKGKLKALYKVHQNIASEMSKRGFNHNSPLSIRFAKGKGIQNEYVASPEEQAVILKGKKCGCKIHDLLQGR